jgi:hypothetical protein
MSSSTSFADDRAPRPNRDASLSLRLAQRALAALLDHAGPLDAWRRELRLRSLQRELSALSADDRDRFGRWFTLLRDSRQRPALQGLFDAMAAGDPAVVRRRPRSTRSAA